MQSRSTIPISQRLGDSLFESGLAGIPLCAALAVILVDEVNLDAIRFLIFLLFACSVGLVIRRLRKGLTLDRIANIAFVAGFVFWYSYPALVSFFLPNYRLNYDIYQFINDETIVWALINLSLFLLSGVVVSTLFPLSNSIYPTDVFVESRTNPVSIIKLALGGSLFGMTPFILSENSFSEILYAISQSRALDKPWLQTENLGNAISPITLVTSSVMVASASLLWIVIQDKRVSKGIRVPIGFIALFVTTIIYFDQGTRSITALIIIPPIIVNFITLWRYSRPRAVVMFLLMSVIGTLLLQFQVLYRSSYTRSVILESISENWMTLRGTIDFFQETLFAVRLVPTFHDYFREIPLLDFLVSPIPRIVWPTKPVSDVVWFFTLSRSNIDIYTQGGNVLPGIVGQYYMSWGWAGPVMIGAFLGWLTSRLGIVLSRINIESNIYFSALGVMSVVWIFISYRLLSPGFLYPVIFAAMIIFASGNSVRLRKPHLVIDTPQTNV